jgi:capsular polysaccharide biosynthesis protein
LEEKISIPVRTLIAKLVVAGPAPGALAAELLPMPDDITDRWIPKWHEEAATTVNTSPATELAVYEFTNLTIFGAEGLLANPDGSVEHDPRFLTQDIKNLLESEDRLRFDGTRLRARVVKERVAVFHAHGSMIYGHFLIDMLPKIALMRRAGHDIGALKFLLCAGTPDWQLPMLVRHPVGSVDLFRSGARVPDH